MDVTATRIIDPWRGTDENPDHAQVVRGPGLIDLYAHSGEPGHEQRETLESLAKAARAGGFTTITILPDTVPTLDQESALRAMRNSLPPAIRWNLLGAMTLGCKGKTLVASGEMASWVVGFTDGQPMGDSQQLRHFLDYIRPLERPFFVYPRQGQLHHGVAFESALALSLGLATIPALAEIAALEMLLGLVRLTGTAMHMMCLTTAQGIELLRRAKAEGLPVTGSVAMHQLIHTENDIISLEPNLRFDPPLGNEPDRQALIAGLKDGTIDAIATNHTPWTYAEKMLPFTQTPPGAIGLELALSLLWSHLIVPGHLDALTLWRALSVGPARVLGWENLPSDWISFDPTYSWTLNERTLRSLSKATPWWGKSLTGKVTEVWTKDAHTSLDLGNL